MSGIDVSEELLSLFEGVKLRHTNKYFTFSLKETGKVAGKSVYDWEINHKAEAASDDKNKEQFDALVASLPAAEPRFIVFDFTDTKADGRLIKKLILIKWCPDSVHFRIKPVIGATYQTLKEKLSGLGKDIQASDHSDLSYDAIKAALA